MTTKYIHPPFLGAHMSISGGLVKASEAAHSLGIDTMQIFTKNASTWREKVISENEAAAFRQSLEDLEIRSVVTHTAYLINLAAPVQETYDKSVHAVIAEMIRSAALGISDVVLHPGSPKDSGPAAGLKRIAEAVNRMFEAPGVRDTGVFLVLETTAGQGSSIGADFAEMAELIETIEAKERIGVCFDTCHAFAAGYDLRSAAAYEKTFQTFLDIFGLDRLRVIHLNDSKGELGKRLDRHAAIGEGEIGSEAFERIINDPRFQFVPKILETPKDKADPLASDQKNLDALRRLYRG